MVKELIHDPFFLSVKSKPAPPLDAPVAKDLLDTLTAHRDSCVGMAANMIGKSVCIIAFCDKSGYTIMYNPEIELRKYITEEEAELKAGTPVLVKYGPLKGLSGKLVRANKKYFLVKEVPGMAVMLKVARWCCTPVLDTK